MDDERFDDEIRQRKSTNQRIILKDGREFTYEYILNSLLNDGIREEDTEYVMEKVLNMPKIAYEYLVMKKIQATDIMPLVERKKKLFRERSREVKIQIDGVFGDNVAFCEKLLENGMCISLK